MLIARTNEGETLNTTTLARPQPDAGTLLLRLFTAWVLVYGTQDNVFSLERMHEFEAFLAQRGVPYPLAAAVLSAYAQFVCGLLILAGLATRWAGAVMAVNFLAALWIAHRGAPFMANVPPLAMLTLSLHFALSGAGRWSLDARRSRRAGQNVSTWNTRTG